MDGRNAGVAPMKDHPRDEYLDDGGWRDMFQGATKRRIVLSKPVVDYKATLSSSGEDVMTDHF